MKKLLSGLLVALFLVLHTGLAKANYSNDSLVDGVVAVVGANVILKSDVENQYLQFRMQGSIQGSPDKVKCTIFENLLFQKLMLNQSELDSVKVTDVQVENELDHRMRYFISQIGSPEKLEEYYNKSIVDIKNELREVIKEGMMIEQTQQKITKDVSITPSEVKAYFKKLPKDSIPDINSEYQIGMIVKRPEIGDQEKDEVRTKLNSFRDRIKKGDDFATLAILYSEDPGSSKKGGELGLFKRGDMVKEFEAVAFKLKPGEVSEVVETENGFHIIQMIERRGDYINVRHILLQPKVSPMSLNRCKVKLDSISGQIDKKKLTFTDAVQRFSDDLSKNNGGLMINPATGESKFESGQLDPKVFFVIDKLKEGDISAPVLTKTDKGKEEYRIYFLKERTTPHKANLEKDYSKIQEWATEKKKMAVIDNWINEKTSKTSIKIMGDYRNCTFQRTWIKK